MTAQPNALAQTADFEFAALTEAKNYRAALLRDFDGYLRGSVLEIGAGIGQITSELLRQQQIRRLVSIEPDQAFCNRIRAEHPDHELVQGTVNDLKSDSDWDAILSINVLEHIEADESELAVYHHLLSKTKGALCLFVPARPEIYAPIDKDFGHFRRYTKPELRAKLKKAGFEITTMRYYNFVGYFAWWASFCLLKKRLFDVGAVRLFDRVIFPVVHRFESRLFAPPIGQSLMAVAVAR
jgi:SAM-dependent methyltransferase